MGVSATHLDWTMVPYVRKSFYKHYKDGIDFWLSIDSEYTDDEETLRKKEYAYIEEAQKKDIGIDDKYFDLESPIYKYALKQTEKEVHQAVEGMYHNLNYVRAT